MKTIRKLDSQVSSSNERSGSYVRGVSTFGMAAEMSASMVAEKMQYKPEHPELLSRNWDSLKSGPEFEVKQMKKSCYMGQVADGKRNGYGVMLYDSGRIYEGKWVDDKRHGKGFERFLTGSTFLGDF